MSRSGFGTVMTVLLVAGGAGTVSNPAAAQTAIQQCGQQYQAAKAGNTLNGMTWNQFRTACVARLKATPAAATAPAAAPAPAVATTPANPLKPVAAAPSATPAPAATAAAAPASSMAAPATTAAGKPVSAGRAAENSRIKECGAEWKANKVTLVAQTPGLKWPTYWHECNLRLKAAGK